MPLAPFRKQISIFVPVADWKAIRHEAARRRIPMTELCRRWLEPELHELRQASHPEAAEEGDDDASAA
jgi:hypothetical protein